MIFGILHFSHDSEIKSNDMDDAVGCNESRGCHFEQPEEGLDVRPEVVEKVLLGTGAEDCRDELMRAVDVLGFFLLFEGIDVAVAKQGEPIAILCAIFVLKGHEWRKHT